MASRTVNIPRDFYYTSVFRPEKSLQRGSYKSEKWKKFRLSLVIRVVLRLHDIAHIHLSLLQKKSFTSCKLSYQIVFSFFSFFYLWNDTMRRGENKGQLKWGKQEETMLSRPCPKIQQYHMDTEVRHTFAWGFGSLTPSCGSSHRISHVRTYNHHILGYFLNFMEACVTYIICMIYLKYRI